MRIRIRSRFLIYTVASAFAFLIATPSSDASGEWRYRGSLLQSYNLYCIFLGQKETKANFLKFARESRREIEKATSQREHYGASEASRFLPDAALIELSYLLFHYGFHKSKIDAGAKPYWVKRQHLEPEYIVFLAEALKKNPQPGPVTETMAESIDRSCSSLELLDSGVCEREVQALLVKHVLRNAGSEGRHLCKYREHDPLIERLERGEITSIIDAVAAENSAEARQSARLSSSMSHGDGRPVRLASLGAVVQEMMDDDASQGKPLTAHVVVALADNIHQGLVPVSEELGNGQNPRTNLYWGALYGIRTFFRRSAGWTLVPEVGGAPQGVLDRVLLSTTVNRTGIGSVPVHVIADAWDGQEMRSAIEHFFDMAGGRQPETISAEINGQPVTVLAGGNAHVVAFVGHNGLMDFEIPETSQPVAGNRPKSAVVLACFSRDFFESLLLNAGAHPLLMTKGRMAPEAYTLDAALKSWFSGEDAETTHRAAAASYCEYQKCRTSWAYQGLFFHSE